LIRSTAAAAVLLATLCPAAPADVRTQFREDRIKAPEFVDVTEWLNTKQPLSLDKLKGQVVVVHFWTFGCINCQRNYPWYRDWMKRYSGRKVTFVGVHSPETKGEYDIETIRKRAKENGLEFPILVDNKLSNWKNWGLRYWPTVWILDKQGYARFRWEGELNWQNAGGQEHMAKRIDQLLQEPDAKR
jgi:thiol-disulfide isomerase/thioredoxin